MIHAMGDNFERIRLSREAISMLAKAKGLKESQLTREVRAWAEHDPDFVDCIRDVEKPFVMVENNKEVPPPNDYTVRAEVIKTPHNAYRNLLGDDASWIFVPNPEAIRGKVYKGIIDDKLAGKLDQEGRYVRDRGAGVPRVVMACDVRKYELPRLGWKALKMLGDSARGELLYNYQRGHPRLLATVDILGNAAGENFTPLVVEMDPGDKGLFRLEININDGQYREKLCTPSSQEWETCDFGNGDDC